MIYSMKEFKERKELSAAAENEVQKELSKVAETYRKQANIVFARVLYRSRQLEPERQYDIFRAVLEGLRLAEMAIDGSKQL